MREDEFSMTNSQELRNGVHFIFLGNLFRFLNLNPNLTLNLQAQEGD
jgi:hypothetical protein